MSSFPSPALFLTECGLAAEATADDLATVAVARGCRHYASMARGTTDPQFATLSHEVLACALLRFPLPEGFDAFRCGAMVLSDPHNRPEVLSRAADYFGVRDRVRHIIDLGLAHDETPVFWTKLAALFPPVAADDELPGLSRFVSESPLGGRGRGPVRIWLRTRWNSAAQ